MTTAGRARYAGYRFSAEIISHAVWLDIARAEVLAGQALAASSSNSLAHFATGQVLRAQRRYAQAIPEYRTAIALNRNFAAAFFALGLSKLHAGSIEETIPLEEQAIRLSPRDPQIGIWYQQIGGACICWNRARKRRSSGNSGLNL